MQSSRVAEFCTPPIPEDEQLRLEALDQYRILDTPRERDFDEIANLASNICGAPIAVVNFIGDQRQFFKAEVGLGIRETPFETSFCGHALLAEEVMIVPDTTQDPRFSGNPLVTGEPFLKFYGGVLIRTPEGQPLGTVCVLDFESRSLSDNQIDSLKMLASHAMVLLQLRLNVQKLDESLAFRERLLGIVSHDLRSPLSVIKMSAGVLAETPELEAKVTKKLADRMLQAADSMGCLVDDLLDHEALEKNDVSLKVREYSVGDLISELDNRFDKLAAARSIEWSIRGESELPGVKCDPTRTMQIFSNLCGNSLKFCRAGDSISVSIDATTDLKYVRFTVEDSGPGIPADEQPSIFAPFWQSTSHDAGGVGLGLSIVKKLVDRQDGTISLDSDFNDGTRFIVSLPAV